MNEENEAAALELINEYTNSFQRNLSGRNADSKQAQHYIRKINEVQLHAINLQRKYINHAVAKDGLDSTVANTLTRILDIREDALNHNLRLGMLHIFKKALHSFFSMKRKDMEEAFDSDLLSTVREVQLKAIEATIVGLEEYAKTQEHPDYVYAVILDYEKIHKNFKRADIKGKATLEKQKEELRLKVLDTERGEIRNMYEAGDISLAQGRELRRFINHVESVVLYEYNE
jgi:CPA1 family monovalent cation:H+ antiporter